jgi:selenocysteine-specific elongation factor
VLQPCPRRIRRRDTRAIERIKRIRDSDAEGRVAAVLAFQGLAPWTEHDLVRDAGVAAGQVAGLVAKLVSAGALVELPLGPRRTVRVLADVAEDLEDRVIRALGRLHAARPRQSAIRRPHVLAELPDLANDALVAGILDRLKKRGAILSDERTVALKSNEPKLSQGERKLKDEIASTYAAAGLSPPDVSEITAKSGSRAAVVPELLNLLVDEGVLTQIGTGLYLDFRADAEMRKRVAEHLTNGACMTMAELRDLLGTTRKYAVPIGEYLDRIGLTRRDGDTRRLNQSASAGTLDS